MVRASSTTSNPLEPRRTISPSASTTTSPAPRWPTTPTSTSRRPTCAAACFIGLGADGTVGANKNSIKIIGEQTPTLRAGLLRLRLEEVGFDDDRRTCVSARVRSAPYLISVKPTSWRAASSASSAAPTCSASPAPAPPSCSTRPTRPRRPGKNSRATGSSTILAKKLRVYVIDATQVAQASGMGRRTNTVLQTCFFALSGVLPQEEAIKQIKKAIDQDLRPQGRADRRR
jgi:pyruvate-ferredoxin/flavodoxin oxidoreductase